jgi:phosphoribosylformylglycinamidine cyclo-ligase
MQGQKRGRARGPVRATSYAGAGVDTEKAEQSLGGLVAWVRRAGALRSGLGQPLMDIGYFANVIRLTESLGLAISTDGVGTKILVAEKMDRLEGVGIDCVAMNVNDVLCVGAEPLAMVDYLAVEDAEPGMLARIGESLYLGAVQARIVIPGGELAQIREMVRGSVEGRAFDLVGTCVGTVPIDGIIQGDNLADGDIVIGLASTGVHSNGFTLVRRVLDEAGWDLDRHVDELGGVIGEILLEPTAIYVREVEALSAARIRPKALLHITGDGLLNLPRVKTPASFVLTSLPEPPPIFGVIQSLGGIEDGEMYSTFNMGVGFCLVVAEDQGDACLRAVEGQGRTAWRIGEVKVDGKREVRLPGKNLVGSGKRFRRA